MLIVHDLKVFFGGNHLHIFWGYYYQCSQETLSLINYEFLTKIFQGFDLFNYTFGRKSKKSDSFGNLNAHNIRTVIFGDIKEVEFIFMI